MAVECVFVMLTLLILEKKNHKKFDQKCVFATIGGKIINFMGMVYNNWYDEAFSLCNICMWNIHDYLTYGLLVGCQMKGYMACPLRDPMVDIEHSSHFKNNVYQGHQHYLSTYHPYQRNCVTFNAHVKHRFTPTRIFAVDFSRREKEHVRNGWLGGKKDKDNIVHVHDIKRKKTYFIVFHINK